MTDEEAKSFADRWVHSWNSHDLDAILEHYADTIVFVSPFVVKLLNDPAGTISDKGVLHEYFRRGLEKFPDLRFELHHVLNGVESVTLVYRSVNNLMSAEVMTLNAAGMVTRVSAHYSATS